MATRPKPGEPGFQKWKESRQWNVRLPADLSNALLWHFRDPMLVGLPKGKVAEFFESAVRRELERLGVSPEAAPTVPSTQSSLEFF